MRKFVNSGEPTKNEYGVLGKARDQDDKRDTTNLEVVSISVAVTEDMQDKYIESGIKEKFKTQIKQTSDLKSNKKQPQNDLNSKVSKILQDNLKGSHNHIVIDDRGSDLSGDDNSPKKQFGLDSLKQRSISQTIDNTQSSSQPERKDSNNSTFKRHAMRPQSGKVVTCRDPNPKMFAAQANNNQLANFVDLGTNYDNYPELETENPQKVDSP